MKVARGKLMKYSWIARFSVRSLQHSNTLSTYRCPMEKKDSSNIYSLCGSTIHLMLLYYRFIVDFANNKPVWISKWTNAVFQSELELWNGSGFEWNIKRLFPSRQGSRDDHDQLKQSYLILKNSDPLWFLQGNSLGVSSKQL